MCFCVPFVQRSHHSFDKSSLFLFLFFFVIRTLVLSFPHGIINIVWMTVFHFGDFSTHPRSGSHVLYLCKYMHWVIVVLLIIYILCSCFLDVTGVNQQWPARWKVLKWRSSFSLDWSETQWQPQQALWAWRPLKTLLVISSIRRYAEQNVFQLIFKF